MSRADNVAQNMKTAIFCQIALAAANFAARKIFVLRLGEDYLGLNGLFSNLLSMLSLAELGFGTSIIFSLYHPVAHKDREKIKSLMQLYRRAYKLVGGFVIAAGVSLTPFLSFFVKEMPQGIPYIEIIYILNVLNSGISYFFIYKASLLFADQKKYIENRITVAVKLISIAFQTVTLIFTGSYLLYLGIMLISTIVQNIWISYKADSLYPFLKEKNVRPLEQADLVTIKRNVGAMVFHKFGHVAVFSTDSILMAKFVSVAAVGLYSNYMLIRKTLLAVIEPVFVSLAASLGNLNACETEEAKYKAFRRVNFFSGWIFGFICICLMNLYNPFIKLWLGENYLFSKEIVFLIVVNFYFYCMRMPVGNMKDVMGLFWNDRYKPIFEVALNFGASVLLAAKTGISGVLLGTLISTILVPFWVEPVVLFHSGLKKNPFLYFRDYFLYLAVTITNGMITGEICKLVPQTAAGFLLCMFVCGVIPNLIYLAVYWHTDEFQYLKETGFRLLKQELQKIKRKR